MRWELPPFRPATITALAIRLNSHAAWAIQSRAAGRRAVHYREIEHAAKHTIWANIAKSSFYSTKRQRAESFTVRWRSTSAVD